MSLDTFIKYELPFWENGLDFIAGVDEVGRGSLAGPLVVSAVIINKKHLLDINDLPLERSFYHEINDSKKLSPKKRDYLSNILVNELISYSFSAISNEQIDQLGIMKCTQIAFSNAIKKLPVRPQHVFTDNFEIKDLAIQSQTNLIKGDSKSLTIAAASILAKVYRDKMMVDYHQKSEKYKVYRFDKHKGYGTTLHREMIKKYGFSDLHRKTFQVK